MRLCFTVRGDIVKRMASLCFSENSHGRTYHLGVRLTPLERAVLALAATRKGQSTSDYLRAAAAAAIKADGGLMENAGPDVRSEQATGRTAMS